VVVSRDCGDDDKDSNSSKKDRGNYGSRLKKTNFILLENMKNTDCMAERQCNSNCENRTAPVTRSQGKTWR
jgi:hypothetical protein